jgi:NAD(P)-dependent dehydrogenase (short-subunit alcohol dehydrogenase family)
MLRITGRSALITGSSRGIGNRQAAEETADRLRQCRAEPLLVQGDITESDDVAKVIETVGASFGRLDILVSNARPEMEHFYQPVMETIGRPHEFPGHSFLGGRPGGRQNSARP